MLLLILGRVLVVIGITLIAAATTAAVKEKLESSFAIDR